MNKDMEQTAKTEVEKKEKKRFTIFGVEFVYLCILGIVFAAIGWIAENAYRAISLGIIDSRFHILPFITPYALVPFAFHLCLGSPDNMTVFGKPLFPQPPTKKMKILSNVSAYVLMCAAVFLSELAIGNLWDKCFGVKLWDYSDSPFHVTQYAGLLQMLGYGTGAYLLFKFFYKPALKFIRAKISVKAAKIVTSTLGVAMVADTLFLIVQIVFFGQARIWWSISWR